MYEAVERYKSGLLIKDKNVYVHSSEESLYIHDIKKDSLIRSFDLGFYGYFKYAISTNGQWLIIDCLSDNGNSQSETLLIYSMKDIQTIAFAESDIIQVDGICFGLQYDMACGEDCLHTIGEFSEDDKQLSRVYKLCIENDEVVLDLQDESILETVTIGKIDNDGLIRPI